MVTWNIHYYNPQFTPYTLLLDACNYCIFVYSVIKNINILFYVMLYKTHWHDL